MNVQGGLLYDEDLVDIIIREVSAACRVEEDDSAPHLFGTKSRRAYNKSQVYTTTSSVTLLHNR